MNIVKYPGGKEKELHLINQYLPAVIDNYYEPFVGGGSVYLDINANGYYINDFSADLINLYLCIKSGNTDFFEAMRTVNSSWKGIDEYALEDDTKKDGLFSIYTGYRDNHLSETELHENISDYMSKNIESLQSIVSPLRKGNEKIYSDRLAKTFSSKFVRMKVLDRTKKHISDEDVRENILGCLKSSYYMYMRHLYNHSGEYSDGFRAMLYLFMRDMCYSSMFRFNSDGEFNVPYGGISYNTKNYDNTLTKYQNKIILEKLNKTVISQSDYYEFLKACCPKGDDFIFVDPPYDSDFSTYDKNSFGAEDQKKLANYLINECKCNFMVDIKCTDFILDLYPEGALCANGGKLNIVFFDKTYSVSFMDRNNRKTEHMLIMNY